MAYSAFQINKPRSLGHGNAVPLQKSVVQLTENSCKISVSKGSRVGYLMLK